MDKLTREEVEHVADLAKLALTEEEIEKYRVELKQLIDEHLARQCPGCQEK